MELEEVGWGWWEEVGWVVREWVGGKGGRLWVGRGGSGTGSGRIRVTHFNT